MTKELNPMKVTVIAFEKSVEVDYQSYGKLILSVTKGDENIIDAMELIVSNGEVRHLNKSYMDVNGGTWMGADSVGIMDHFTQKIMAQFKFYRAIPLYSGNKRNPLITGVHGQIVLFEDQPKDVVQQLPAKVISLHEENIIFELIEVTQRQSWLMENEGKTLEEVLVAE